jgi:hypothetical protein
MNATNNTNPPHATDEGTADTHPEGHVLGYLMDPVRGTLRSVVFDPNDNAAIYGLLNCSMMEFVTLSDTREDGSRVALIVDEEGRLTYPNENGYFTLEGNLYCGRGLFVSTKAGKIHSACLDPVRLMTVLAALRGAPPPEAVEPRIEVVSWSDRREHN